MDALRHSKRHHNIETETVVRLAVKLMRSNSSSSSNSVDRWTQVVDLYVQSVVYHSEYRTIRIQ